MIFADLPQNVKTTGWCAKCQVSSVTLQRYLAPPHGLQVWCNVTCGKDSMLSRRIFATNCPGWFNNLQIVQLLVLPLCQPPQEFHQCEALKILWPTLNKEFKQWNTRQNSWNGLNVVQQIVWKQLEFLGSKTIVLVTIEVNRSRWNHECYAPSRVGVRCI